METIRIKRRAEEDGTVTISVPPSFSGVNLEILIVKQPDSAGEVGLQQSTEAVDLRGWPVGFFEETYGSLASNPLERLPQGEFEIREALK